MADDGDYVAVVVVVADDDWADGVANDDSEVDVAVAFPVPHLCLTQFCRD